MGDILIVDDERDIRELIGDILKDEGFSVRLAGNSTEAMTKINQWLTPEQNAAKDNLVHEEDHFYGAYDEAILERTRGAGYRFGVTTEPGVNEALTDPLRLRRFTAKGCKFYHPLKFRRMILTAEREAGWR